MAEARPFAQVEARRSAAACRPAYEAASAQRKHVRLIAAFPKVARALPRSLRAGSSVALAASGCLCKRRAKRRFGRVAMRQTSRSNRDASFEVPTGKSLWRHVAGCDIVLPSGEQPDLVIHFLGAPVACSAPYLFYKSFIELLAQETNAAIVATPYDPTADAVAAATQARRRFEDACVAFAPGDAPQLTNLPVFGVGHSMGAVIALLVHADHMRRGNILLGFNLSAPAAVLQPPVPSSPSLPLDGMPGWLGAAARRVLPATASAQAGQQAPGGVGEVAAVLAQAFTVLAGAVAGAGSTRRSRDNLESRFKAANIIFPRTLLVEFSGDTSDEAAWMLSIFGCQEQAPRSALDMDDQLSDAMDQALEEAMEEAMREEWGEDPADVEEYFGLEESFELGPVPVSPVAAPPEDGRPVVERTRLQGDLRYPFNLAGEGDHETGQRMHSLVGAVARFLRGEPGVTWGQGLLSGGRFALRERLMRLVSGCSPLGHPLSSRRSADTLACVRELEALGMPVGDVPPAGGAPEVPRQLIGCWRLIWSSAPSSVALSALPLVTCGEVRQDIATDPSDGRLVVVEGSVEISPQFAALLGSGPGFLARAFPGAAGGLGAKITWRARGSPQWSNAVSLQPTRASWDPLGLAALLAQRLPEALRGNASFTTTFLDSEVRIARVGSNDVYVFLRVSSPADEPRGMRDKDD